MRALRESASRGERHQARHMRQETGQHDKAGDAPVEEQAVGPSMPNERRWRCGALHGGDQPASGDD